MSITLQNVRRLHSESSYGPVGPQMDGADQGTQELARQLIKSLWAFADRGILGDESTLLTGSEVLDFVGQFDEYLRISTPQRGRVAILLPPGLPQALSIIGCICSGRVPVVLNHWSKPEVVAEWHREHGFDGLVSSASAELDACHIPARLMVDRHLDIEALETTDPIANPHADHDCGAAIILFTSGSTGNPKAVHIPASGIVYIVTSLIDTLELGPDSVATVTLPLFHTMGLITQFLPTLIAGGKTIVLNSELSTGRLYRDIENTSGTFVALISDMLKFLKDEKSKRELPVADKVSLVQLAGGHINTDHLKIAREIFPNAVIYKGYGLTEAIRVTMISSDDPAFDSDCAGYVLNGQTVEIRDESGRPVPAGKMGEIYVQGPNVTLGYGRSRRSPVDQKGFLRTGDLGSLATSGLLTIHGRRDHVFKSNGRKVAPRELEQRAVLREEVLQSLCLPLFCPAKGLRPMLMLELDEALAKVDSPEWRKSIVDDFRMSLEPYKMPKVVVAAKIPRLPNGKVDRSSAQRVVDQLLTKAQPIGTSHGCRFFDMG